MIYLLDTNIFIQAKNLHYGLDFCPAFWEWLIENNKTGKVFSIEEVRDEINVGKDELSTWAKDRNESFFLKLDDSVEKRLHDVSQWVITNGYGQAAVDSFFQGADCYLVAHTLAYGYKLVTHETSISAQTPDSNQAAKIKQATKIKIPDVCAGMDIECISPHKIECISSYDMLREEGARFVLDPNR